LVDVHEDRQNDVPLDDLKARMMQPPLDVASRASEEVVQHDDDVACTRGQSKNKRPQTATSAPTEPSFINLSTKCDPMKPAPPVINIRF
jgi:hypothetical protein